MLFIKGDSMKYCSECGEKLILKKDGIDGLVPFCPTCGQFRYPMSNMAVSAIIMQDDQILLIKQYGQDRNILVAGYINYQESAEEALKREIKEEVGLDVVSYEFNQSRYYEKSNTLMLNFVVRTKGEVIINEEIDSFEWFDKKIVLDKIAPNSLAKHFMELSIEKKLIK